jgi:hypothetical protein
MESGRHVIPLKIASASYFNPLPSTVPKWQTFKLNFWGACKIRTNQCGGIKCCMLIELQKINNIY